MKIIIEAAKRLQNVQANDAVEYVPTPGAKKEKNKEWKPDVPVVTSDAVARLNATKASQQTTAAKPKHMPKLKSAKPSKAKAPMSPEPKRKKVTKAATDVAVVMASVMRRSLRLVTAGEKDYEVAYLDNNGKMKRKNFKTDAEREKWIDKQGDNIEVDSYRDPD